ncbi:MAG: cobalamin-dependent protein [Candidatus Omnitrophica bacterium]|nr:cobalamin-dependent protein [Candidatus Omnitrophota bacterium]
MPDPKKISFLNPPLSPDQRYGILSAAGASEPPLGLAYLAALTRQAGLNTGIIDAQALGLGVSQAATAILADRPDYLAITVSTMSFLPVIKLATMIKAADPTIKILVGGSHVSACPEATLRDNACFDIGIVGEGERTLAELLPILNTGEDLSGISGIVFCAGGRVVVTAPRCRIDDLDQLPLPAFDLLPDIARYYRPAAQSIKYLPAISLVTSRGCAGQCLFCDRKTFGNEIRMHSAAYIADMMERLSKDFGIRSIFFEDDNFMLSESRLADLARVMDRRRLKISWSALSRIDTINVEKIRIAKSCGCWQILFGIESGSQKILDFYHKNITLVQIKDALAMTKRGGLHTKGFLMIGNPLESRETLQETRDLVMGFPLDDISVTYFTPYPGAEIWDKIDQYGKVDKDWDSFTCFDPVFIPHGLTQKDLSDFQKNIYAAFYSRPGVMLSYVSRLRSWPQAMALVKSFWSLKAHVGGVY